MSLRLKAELERLEKLFDSLPLPKTGDVEESEPDYLLRIQQDTDREISLDRICAIRNALYFENISNCLFKIATDSMEGEEFRVFLEKMNKI